MAQKKNEKVQEISKLVVSNQKFKEDIESRIEFGNKLSEKLANDHSATLNSLQNEYDLWNDYNKEYLKVSFNIDNNEYRNSYADAGYSFMGQLGELPNNPKGTLSNLINYKLNNLQKLLTKADLIRSDQTRNHVSTQTVISKTHVFIVHGHDETAKVKAARFIEQLGFKPIILHEQSSSGKTIIEKIEENTNVGFGIVLYTPCDVGSTISDQGNLKFRARQNVVFEHGFLIGKIGRANVCALVKDDLEIPNDISGVVYVKMDAEDAWHLKIAKELRSSGYSVDLNKL